MNKSTLDEKKNSINSTKKIIVCGGGLVSLWKIIINNS